MGFRMDSFQAFAFPFIPAVSHGRCPAPTMRLSLPRRTRLWFSFLCWYFFFFGPRKNIVRNHAYEMLIISILFLSTSGAGLEKREVCGCRSCPNRPDKSACRSRFSLQPGTPGHPPSCHLGAFSGSQAGGPRCFKEERKGWGEALISARRFCSRHLVLEMLECVSSLCFHTGGTADNSLKKKKNRGSQGYRAGCKLRVGLWLLPVVAGSWVWWPGVGAVSLGLGLGDWGLCWVVMCLAIGGLPAHHASQDGAP